MYIIGDAKCAATVEMWGDVIAVLKRNDRLGTGFRLNCPRHPELLTEVRSPSDFEILAPEGGCTKPCGQELECKHFCELKCHAEFRHKSPCQKPCLKPRLCGHDCPKRCSEDCGKCVVPVGEVPLPCGHTLQNAECWIAQDPVNEDIKSRCRTPVTRKLPGCEHEVEMPCGEDPSRFKCGKECGGTIGCHHLTCRNRCSSCVDGGHGPCKQKCDKDLTNCSHRCHSPCHSAAKDDCGPCNAPCEIRCGHARCKGKCGQKCIPCTEPCLWSCDHMGQCQMRCGALCDRLPCNLRCAKLIDCGHQCPSICGEICPSNRFCPICGPLTRNDGVEPASSESLNLDNDPIIVLPCQHSFTTSFLDAMFEIDTLYARNETGQFTHTRAFESQMRIHSKRCPTCRMSISGVHRYNRILKRDLVNFILKDLINHYQLHYLNVLENLENLEVQLPQSRKRTQDKILHIRDATKARPITMHNIHIILERTGSFSDVRGRIQRFKYEVDEQHQPHMTLHNLSRTAKTPLIGSERLTETDPLDLRMPLIKYRMLANISELRLEALLHDDMIQLVNTLSSKGCPRNEVNRLYVEVARKCKIWVEKASRCTAECEEGKYRGHAVETMLLQIQFISLTTRALRDTSETSRIAALEESAQALLTACEAYLRKYFWCQRHKQAIESIRPAIISTQVPLYETMSREERMAIIRTMNSELHDPPVLYQCRNSHVVSLLYFPVSDSI